MTLALEDSPMMLKGKKKDTKGIRFSIKNEPY
jgi:hypothetical protein